MPERKRSRSRKGGLTSIDTAVRAALAESHSDLLRFLTRRLGTRDEAEEVLSTFYVRSLGLGQPRLRSTPR